ncbi:MAG: hypothetical protein KJZ64_02275 [Sphingomonadaceae bacterium]|nr:hypothetical protein [Sphingomonadaceae bacterium]
MTPRLRLPLLVLPLALLAACDKGTDNAAPAERRAEGEVLGGTISDDMIPLEQLRSQSPPMRAAPGEGGANVGGADEAGPQDGAAAPEEPAPAEPASATDSAEEG